MARLARVVAPGVPHHATQRGNRRQQVFFCDDDYETYRALLADGCRGTRTGCAPRSARRTGVTPGASISARAGAAICGSGGLRRFRWTSGTCWPARAMSSSTRYGLVAAGPLLALAPDWRAFLAAGQENEDREAIRASARTGRPLGHSAFVERLEKTLARPLKRRKPGRKPRTPMGRSSKARNQVLCPQNYVSRITSTRSVGLKNSL